MCNAWYFSVHAVSSDTVAVSLQVAGKIVDDLHVSLFISSDPLSVATLSCVDLSEDVSGTVSVTVSWTLSGGDSADFSLINITTNAPQTPYGGLLNITGSVTQHELTGFMTGYEYNITVRGVTSNCGGLVGRDSEPLTIRPQGNNTTGSSESSSLLLWSLWNLAKEILPVCYCVYFLYNESIQK